MKKILSKLYMFLGIGAMLVAQGCDDFLTINPEDQFSKDNYWQSEANVQLYSWKFYDMFLGYGNGSGTTAEFYFQASPSNGCIAISDDLANASFLRYNANSVTTSSEWNSYYSQIRAINVMLEELPKVSMPAESSKHWEGVAKFFRGFAYYMLVQRYGDVPYVDKAAKANEPQNIYVARTPRAQVMEKILNDLNFAVANIRENDGANAINRYTALALLSRVALFEGTYIKYHGLQGNANEYLTKAKTAAETIITSGKYVTGTNFKAIYNSLDLGSNKEVILSKKYLPSVLANSIQAYTNSSSIINGLTKFAVESYVCNDGLPISQSALYQGDNSLPEVLANRDSRLLATIDNRAYGYADKTLSGLSSSTGYVTNLYNNWVPPALPGTDVTTIAQNHIDAPIFSYSEVLLNYAEACAELGNCTQADLDLSVNVLREKHASLPKLVLAGADVSVNGVVIDDPKRNGPLETMDGSTVVSSLIWEIRRERRAELMTWTYIRYYDLMRWHRGHYLDSSRNADVALGAKLVGVTLTNTKVNVDGYINPYTLSRAFEAPKHYLNSIPLNEITLYANENVVLTQNPGWSN